MSASNTQQPIDNKTTQKVKEAISRMVKSDMRCVSVILDPEQTSPDELMHTTVARMLPLTTAFKSGKTEYMCDGGRVVLLVNYWEPTAELPTNTNAEEKELPEVNSGNCNTMQMQMQMQYVIIGVIIAPTVHDSFTSDPIPVKNLLDTLSPVDTPHGAITIEFPVAETINSVYKQPVLLGVRRIQSYTAFKEVDQVVQRFYEYMRQIGLIQDEPEEDMGALADAAGIEW
jgi:hypothetical protein